MVRAHRLARASAAGALITGLFTGLPAASAAPAGSQQTYIVLYANQSAVPVDAAAGIAKAGGRLVISYDAIGVAIATSTNTAFQNTIRQDSRVLAAAQSARGMVRLKDRVESATDGAALTTLVNQPAPGNDRLSGLQWDMRQINAPQARAITGGSASVLVGDIDTGLDYTHPDLAPNVDFANSASCIGGTPNPAPAAWDDDNGHGTHTAGTIAAARNDVGIVGVAPNVKIAGIKAGNADGFFFPEAVICSFMWAGTHGIDITNNSYFADPFYFNCPSDPEQKAILQAEERAIRFAQNNGVVVISSAGNFSDDLAHPTLDDQSPDNATPIENRPVNRSCRVVPSMVPGVITVSATGDLSLKSFYSSYGIGIVSVAAPGGDSILQVTPEATNGRVLSTYPPEQPCTRKVVDPVLPAATYCYLQGTSMASPHAAGVAALILSREDLRVNHNPGRSGRVQTLLERSANPIACPSAAVLAQYEDFPSVNNDAPQTCQGSLQYNSWYGHGEIDALKALTTR
jgi:lantibiotic leader peptide-processing serine protease